MRKLLLTILEIRLEKLVHCDSFLFDFMDRKYGWRFLNVFHLFLLTVNVGSRLFQELASLLVWVDLATNSLLKGIHL